MGQNLIDTNVLLEYVAKTLPHKAHIWMNKTIEEDFNISIINKIEVLGHHSATEALEEFLGLADVYELSDDIVKQTILLRKAQKMKLPDAIIAATALVYDMTLISRNISDFKNIQGLKVIDPHAL